MKKTAGILLMLILFCMGGITVLAESAIYKTAGDLYQAWCDGSAQMPDYLCGVWSSDGGSENLTFGIQNTDEGNLGKQEILDLVEDDSSVSFVYQKYSESYLNQIQDEIFPYFEKDLGLVSSGVYVMENHVGIEIHKGRKNDDATKQMIKELEAKYGDAISITYAEGYVVATTDQLSTGPSSVGISLLNGVLIALALALVLAVILFFAIKSKTQTLVTNTGATVSSSAYSSADVEKMAAQSEDFPSQLDEKISSFIDSH